MADIQTLNGKYSQSTLRQWILCFVVCNFNVDIGPEVEVVYPSDTPFSAVDLSTICFDSFPERHDGEITEDMYYNFTLRNNSPDINLTSPSPPYGSPESFHGVTVFRQEYDGSSKRRFNQKSLVIISNHEFSSFFMNLLRVIVTGSNIGDITRLESACAQIEGWPPPRIGTQELPFLGGKMVLEIPPYQSFPLSGLPSPLSASTSLLSHVSAYEPTENWPSLLPLLHSPATLYILYERLLLGDPIIVLGTSPSHVSAIITALTDLIRPIPYAGTIRPYLPMQSTGLMGEAALFDPSAYTTPYIAGITNPFLLQRLSTPNIPNISTPYILALSSPPTAPNLNAPNTTTPSSGYSILHPSRSLRHRHSSRRIDVPGTPIKSQPKPIHHLKADRTFLTALSDAHSGDASAALGVRRHFADLTAKLLAPANRFLATGADASAAIAVSQASGASQVRGVKVVNNEGEAMGYESKVEIQMAVEAGEVSNFSVDAFLLALESQVPAPFVGQTVRGRQRSRDAFYARFCASGNFEAWLELRRANERLGGAGLLGG
ncbi:hypothetical protein BT63DRAFT_429236 [Microthyrium microscopicum]|uniref:UDENN domain-containing protein n=1 Tax=Microthyrium microscopicum TaxID=703497 RepID=A0A6A6TWN5_9PEZI|nr:hypothetical protein BT63DRAFT_429236 [Microthyrium microscopicum]